MAELLVPAQVPEKWGSQEVGLGPCRADQVYRSGVVTWLMGSDLGFMVGGLGSGCRGQSQSHRAKNRKNEAKS